MILTQMKHNLLLGVVLWTHFYQLLVVVKFKYFLLPMRYSYKKLTNLTACFDFINLRFILQNWLTFRWNILSQQGLWDLGHGKEKVWLFLSGEFCKAFTERFVYIGDFFGDFLFFCSFFCVVLKHLEKEFDFEGEFNIVFDRVVLFDERFLGFRRWGFFLEEIVHGVFISSFDFYSGVIVSIYLLIKLMLNLIKTIKLIRKYETMLFEYLKCWKGHHFPFYLLKFGWKSTVELYTF